MFSSKLRFKIFTGKFPHNPASEKLNQWLDQNSDIMITKWEYQTASEGMHSICVEYTTMKCYDIFASDFGDESNMEAHDDN